MPGTQAIRYRLEDLPQDSPIALLRRRRIIGEQAMLCELVVEKGCAVASHRHANEQFIVLLSGRMRFTLSDVDGGGEREIDLTEGEVMYLPSDVPHGAQALEDCRMLDVFSPASEKTGIDR
jgi:quercetin dioxygenase-like cupin family protein